MRGYWQHPEETAAVLDGGWLSTGDVAQMTPTASSASSTA